MSDYDFKTVNVKKKTHKKLQQLKIEKEYDSFDDLIQSEIFEDE